jgi:hypothetical protein
LRSCIRINIINFFYFILTVGIVRRLVAVGLIFADDGRGGLIVEDGMIPFVGGYIGRDDDTTGCCLTADFGILII